jgi:hypothetical protein
MAITCIGGVGAFDHVLRSRIFAEILVHPVLQVLAPHVMLWYGSSSKYIWTDAHGHPHEVDQGESGAGRPPYAGLVLSRRPSLLSRTRRPNSVMDKPRLLTLTTCTCSLRLTDAQRSSRSSAGTCKNKCCISVNQGKLQSWCPRGGSSPAGLLIFSTPENTVWRSDKTNGVVVVGTPHATTAVSAKLPIRRDARKIHSWNKSAPFRLRRRPGSSCFSARSPALGQPSPAHRPSNAGQALIVARRHDQRVLQTFGRRHGAGARYPQGHLGGAGSSSSSIGRMLSSKRSSHKPGSFLRWPCGLPTGLGTTGPRYR